MAAVYASKGYQVIGVDINDKCISAICNGNAPVAENQLEEFISEHSDLIDATKDADRAVKQSFLSFIIVPTPSDSEGGFSADYVVEACKTIGLSLKSKEDFHLVVLTSTLLPGECEDKIIPVLEEYSGKKCGKNFGFCYSPEFIAIGTVVRDLLNPDFFLVGESDKPSGEILENFYKTVSDNGAEVKRMSISSAELTKISVNSFLTMKITFANMLTEVAENISGVDIDAVTDAMGNDKRIGKHYLRGGLGFGGPCFPRDNRAFAHMAKTRGVEVPYAAKTDEYNKSIIDRSVAKILSVVSKENDVVSIIGLSYKPGTYFSEESQAVAIADKLAQAGCMVHVHNPDGNDHAKEFLGERVIYHENLKECAEKGSVLFLANVIGDVNAFVHLVKDMGGITIVDPWRQMMNEVTSGHLDNITYVPFGKLC